MGSHRSTAARRIAAADAPTERFEVGVPRSPSRRPSVAEGWVRQVWPVRILRAFLGVTFLYAGVQKLADPNFLHAGTPDYIGEQLAAFGRGSPIHAILAVFGHLPALTGIGIALLEIAVGLGTLLGIAAVAFASLGLVVNLVLFLSATWHVHPYFLGSDSIYAVAWLALVVALVQDRLAARRVPVHGSRRQRAAMQASAPLGRREFLRGAVVGAGTILFGMAATAVRGTPSRAASALLPRANPSSSPTRGKGGASTPLPARSVGGTPVAKLDRVPVGGAVGFTDPATGDPAVLLRPTANTVEAFSRVCTHAGCPVQWDQANKLLVCPCHGAEFDPAQGAAPIAGPAPTPLARIQVAVDAATGEVVATS